MAGFQEKPTPDQGRAMPPYSEVFRTRGYLALFLAAALSTWGDYLARVVVAAYVLERTGSPFAAAATFAVSLLPSIFGRSLLAPIADRVPYKYVLVVAHISRAVLVGVLIVALRMAALDTGADERFRVPLWTVFGLLFLIELVGGPAVSAGQILMTDLFSDRRLYARALGLGTMSEQVNQAIGLTIGGFVVAWLGPVRGLVFDLGTFLLSALVISVVVKAQAVRGTPSAGVVGFFRDIGEGASYLFRHAVLMSLLALSLCSVWAMAAPEAVAIAYAQDQSGSTRLGGLLMAAPILGAVAGLLMVGRWQPQRQNSRIIVMALLMPLPLLLTVFAPPLPITWLLWFACGVLQAFMLPLQSTFSLVVPAEMRGRVFGLGGALSVAASGAAFLVAGYLAELTSPATAVASCAAASLLAILLLGSRWPRKALSRAVAAAYDP
ncbi:MAG: MFS transporter [Actinomycetota bacterium]